MRKSEAFRSDRTSNLVQQRGHSHDRIQDTGADKVHDNDFGRRSSFTERSMQIAATVVENASISVTHRSSNLNVGRVIDSAISR